MYFKIVKPGFKFSASHVKNKESKRRMDPIQLRRNPCTYIDENAEHD